MEHQTQAARSWTLTETHTLLDLIRDMGFTQALTRKSYQNWEVFERLCVLLGRCSIHVSSMEVKSHWQALKVKFLSLKRLLDMGLCQASGITVDFPFYEEMQQLLTPQSKAISCRREADSTGLEEQDFPSSSMSISEDQAVSSSNLQADGGAGLAGEAPPGDMLEDAGEIISPGIRRLVVMLRYTTQQLMGVVERLERLSRVEEQLS